MSENKKKTFKNLQISVKNMCRAHWNVLLPAAREQNLVHVMFKPEIGWAISGHQWLKQHARLDSATIFVPVQLVVRLVFPIRDFRLWQYSIFDVLREV